MAIETSSCCLAASRFTSDLWSRILSEKAFDFVSRVAGAGGARRGSRPSLPDGADRRALAVCHAGVTYRVAVKRVGTARRFTLRVRSATQDAVLTMPPRASLGAAQAFAERHAEWIGTRLAGLPRLVAMVPGTMVPLRGVDHVVMLDPAARKATVECRPAGLDAPAQLRVAGDAGSLGQTLLAFLRREAHRDLTACVSRHARTIGKVHGRITVRDTRSRWGSCSSRGTLSFSWRLILAPEFVLDYLVAHEVAHLAHMNHSPEFWALTRRLAPQTATAERWLKTNGPLLHRYAVP